MKMKLFHLYFYLIKGTVRVNFYSKILKKTNRYSIKNSLSGDEEIMNLEKYFLNRINL